MLSTLEKPVAPFLTAWMGPDSPPRYRTQTCQLLSTLSPTRSLSRNASLLVSYTNYLTPPQTTFATSLKLQTNLSSNHDTTPVSISVNPPHSTLTSVALKNFASVPRILLLRKATVIWLKYIHFRFVSSLYVLATLTRGLDDTLVSLK